MQVVILCGGLGTRIREETQFKPKPMIEIGNKPIIWHLMKIYSTYGFNDFILCLGYKQEIIRKFFLDYRHMYNDLTLNLASKEKIVHHKKHEEDWNVTLIDTGIGTKKGTRVKKIESFIKEDRFMLTYGDGLADINIKKLIDFHNKQGKIATFTGAHSISRFGAAETDEKGEIIGWNEKRVFEQYVNAGFFVFERKIFDYLDGDYEIELEPLMKLAKERQLAMYKHDSFWHCMDTYKDYDYLQSLWKKENPPWKIW